MGGHDDVAKQHAATKRPAGAERAAVVERGPWRFELGPAGAEHVTFAGHEVLRSVRFVVRDHNWGTAEPVRLSQRIDTDRVEVVSEHRASGITYRSRLRFEFRPDPGPGRASGAGSGPGSGVLVLTGEGEALTAFRRNRIGLCLLHPAGLAGVPVTLAHPDGSREDGRFPAAISPHQPFRELAGMSWHDDGIRVDLGLDGEVFETEDQRNWTDASFKTYGTPLDLPFPVAVAAGERLTHRLTIRASGAAGRATGATGSTVRSVGPAHSAAGPGLPGPGSGPGSGPPVPVRIGEPGAAVLPSIGLGAASLDETGTAPPGFPAAHLLAEIPLDGRAAERIAAALRQAGTLDCPLHLWCVTDRPERLEAVAAHLGPRITVLGCYHPATFTTTPDLAVAGRRLADRAGVAGLRLAGGTRGHFAELNRMGAIPPGLDIVTVSVTPQFHVTETAYLAENAGMLRPVTVQARDIAGGRPVHVGPITLAPRVNPVADDPADAEIRRSDARQPSCFAGAWTLAALAAAAAGEPEALTFFQAADARGVAGPDGRRYPAGQVLAELAAFRGAPLRAVTGTDTGLPVLAVGAEEPLVAVGNLGPAGRIVSLRLPAGLAASGAARIDREAARRGAAGPAEAVTEAIALAPGEVFLLRCRASS